MSKQTWLAICLGSAAVVFSSCESQDENEQDIPDAGAGTTGNEGGGGPIGSGGSDSTSAGGGLGGGGGALCDADFVECCEAPDGLPCQDLSEAECEAQEYCAPVRGVPLGEGGAGGNGFVFDDAIYLGCFSFCQGDVPAISCTFDPTAPEQCYQTPSAAAPDGWTVFNCNEAQPNCVAE